MHLLSLYALPPETITEVIDTALTVKAAPERHARALAGKSLYMLFEKSSTRTSLSFALGMEELGGRYFVQQWEDSNFPLGAIEDEVRYVARNVDVIMARMKRHEDIARMAEYAPVPVINGCCNRYHPCQGLADLLTLHELFGGWQVRVLYIGVLNNVFNALAGSLPRLGGELTAITPIVQAPSRNADLLARAAATGRFTHIDAATLTPEAVRALVRDADVVYADTWMDMEHFHDPAIAEEKQRRLSAMEPFQLNEALLDGRHCRVMHDMPMHPGVEITRAVIEAHLPTILQQAENRRHAQKGLLLHLCAPIPA